VGLEVIGVETRIVWVNQGSRGWNEGSKGWDHGP